jgi:type VI secretion system protein ImpK
MNRYSTNLPRNFSSIVVRASSAPRLVEQAIRNADPTRRMTMSSLANAAASANATTVTEAASSPTAETPATPSSPVTPPAVLPARDPTVLQFPVPAADNRAPRDSADCAPVVFSQPGDQVAILKGGQQSASWSNPFVSHALPAILQLQRHLADGSLNQSAVRTQLGLEVRLYRERLASSDCEWQQIQDASYLLCTYLDEKVNDAARAASQTPYDGERSLLVEFHDDAWGGEDAFSDLARWMKADAPPITLLAFYELILSLGWQGRYRVLDRGHVLLQDLRSQLHAQIWHRVSPEPLGTPLIAPIARQRRRWWTPSKVSAAALGAVLLSYGIVSLMLDAQSKAIRNALAAWMPPVRTINLAQTLPPPLPQLLSEGWLTAYKHPQGWLLVFRSDGAFDTGKAEVRADFERNIERLGLAFAPWPGDLEVIGHTDRQPIHTGAYADNQALSEARARTVADDLRRTALPGGAQAPSNTVQRTIQYSGRGDTQPVDPARTPAAYERNRRVDVLWKVIPAQASATPRQGQSQDIAAQSEMPDGVDIAPDGQSPYATESRQP